MKDSHRHSVGGFTLVEVIVALALSTGLLTGIVQIFTNSKQTSQLDSAISDLQDNGRIALENLSNTLRYRGFQGCPTPRTGNATQSIIPYSTMFPIQDLWKESLLGYEVYDNNTWSNTPLNDQVNNNLSLTNLKNSISNLTRSNSDVVSIYHASTNFTTLLNDITQNNTADIKVNASLAPDVNKWIVGDFGLVSDCTNVSLFTVTSATPNPNVQNPTSYTLGHSNNIGGMSANQNSNFPFSFYANANYSTSPPNIQAQVRKASVDTFFIGNSQRKTGDNKTIYSLYRSRNNAAPVEIAEGIEYLSIQYGETFSDGTVRYLNADEVTDFRSVQSVRIGILVSSSSNTRRINDTTTYNLPGMSISPNTITLNKANGNTVIAHGYSTDGLLRLRKAFVTTVFLRNAIDITTT